MNFNVFVCILVAGVTWVQEIIWTKFFRLNQTGGVVDPVADMARTQDRMYNNKAFQVDLFIWT